MAGAARLAVLTGAGISAESGIPTFRGPGGLWRNFRPEDLATPDAFRRDPRLVWEWYDWRRQLVAQAEPNAGHRALRTLEERGSQVAVITQNVDGLHRAAGSTRVHELHGSIWTLRCTGCGAERDDQTVPLAPLPPRCACGALLRPGVVWFGEALPAVTLEAAIRDACAAAALLVVGTSAVVYPAAGIALAADRCGIPVIEINPEQTELSSLAAVSIRGKAGEVLPRLLG